MTDTVDLPPLPETVATIRRWGGLPNTPVSIDIAPPVLRRLQDGDTLHAASQVLAYGAECDRRAVERCARILDDLAADALDRSAIREHRGYREIAAAIRKAP
jgi:hypothetical protein